MEIKDAVWFNKVGIVMVEDEYEGIKFYIGACEGLNEEFDRKQIADWGSTFPKSAGMELFGVSE